ncbi:MAG TPA: DUF2079 domain-containing protein, partial [Tepidisphaeraceae bacterium]|nr:DUF2079 domain-containing protein [Tepidisphaeraceae bacterium]
LPIVVPVIWGLNRRAIAPLLGALPIILLNVISQSSAQRSIFSQYSLPIVPFVFTAVIAALAMDRAWLRRGRAIVAWSIALFCLAFVVRIRRVQSQYAMDWEGISQTHSAIRQIGPSGKVLTTFESVPHLSHRAGVQYIGNQYI